MNSKTLMARYLRCQNGIPNGASFCPYCSQENRPEEREKINNEISERKINWKPMINNENTTNDDLMKKAKKGPSWCEQSKVNF